MERTPGNLRLAKAHTDDKEISLLAVATFPHHYLRLSERLRNDKDIAIAAVKHFPLQTRHFPQHIRWDVDVMYADLLAHGFTFNWLTRDMVLELVQRHGAHIGPSKDYAFSQDYAITLASGTLRYARHPLGANLALCAAIVRANPEEIKYVERDALCDNSEFFAAVGDVVDLDWFSPRIQGVYGRWARLTLFIKNRERIKRMCDPAGEFFKRHTMALYRDTRFEHECRDIFAC